MIDAQGTVVAVDGEYAVVQMDEAGCGRCDEPGGCGGHNIGRMLCVTPRTFRVLNTGQASIGTRVTVVIAEGAVRRSAAFAYGIPLLFLFIGAVGGTVVAGEIGAIAGSVGGLLVSGLTIRTVLMRGKADQHAYPYIRG